MYYHADSDFKIVLFVYYYYYYMYIYIYMYRYILLDFCSHPQEFFQRSLDARLPDVDSAV